MAPASGVYPSIISNIFIIFIQKCFDSNAKIKWLTMKHDPLAHRWLVGLPLVYVAEQTATVNCPFQCVL